MYECSNSRPGTHIFRSVWCLASTVCIEYISSSLPTCVCCDVYRGVKGQLFEKKCSMNSFGLKTSPNEEE